MNETDTIYFGTPLTFDPSMVELLLALYTGACLLILPQEHKYNPNILFKILKSQITFLQIVPSLFLRFSNQQISNILLNSELKILAFGGESFPLSLLNFKKTPTLRLFNLYGITEMSCWATIHEVDFEKNTQEIPLGKPLADTIIKINETQENEIFIGSQTRVCFINNITSKNEFFHATGDIGKLSNDSKIFYIGRKNDTVKRLGHKINLNKIEEMIEKETDLKNKCVWFESKLLNFLVIENYQEKDKILDKLRIKLLHALPPQYYPDFFDIIPKIPLSSHGKANKILLQNIYLENKITYTGKYEILFKNLLFKYLGVDESVLDENVHSSFIQMGGNSILAIQLLSEFCDLLRCENSQILNVLFQSDLASCLDSLKNFQPIRKCELNAPIPITQIKRLKTSHTNLKINWKYNLMACVDATPLVFPFQNKTLVAVGSFSHIFVVLDAISGLEIAKFVLPDVIECQASLSFCSNLIYIGCFDGKLYCLDFIKKEIKWTYKTGDRIKCKATTCADSSIVVGSYDKFLYCLDPVSICFMSREKLLYLKLLSLMLTLVKF